MVKTNKGFWKILVNATIEKDGKYLFGKRNDSGLWELIGGKIEPNEQPYDTIKRELKEELSLDCVVKGVLHTYTKQSRKEDDIVNILHLNMLIEPLTEPHLNKECHSEIKWFSLEELKEIFNKDDYEKIFCFGVDEIVSILGDRNENKC